MVLSFIKTGLSDYNSVYDSIFHNTGSGIDTSIIKLITVRGSLFYIATTLVNEMILLGFTIYTLRISRGETGSLWTLFEGFEYIVRYIILYILRTVIVFLATLVFVFPGIILLLMFSQATFILIDNPKMGPVECLARSARMMKGHKAEFFVLQLSLVGWYLLSGVCTMILSSFGVVVYIWIYPYTYLIFAQYYNELLARQDPDTGGQIYN